MATSSEDCISSFTFCQAVFCYLSDAHVIVFFIDMNHLMWRQQKGLAANPVVGHAVVVCTPRKKRTKCLILTEQVITNHQHRLTRWLQQLDGVEARLPSSERDYYAMRTIRILNLVYICITKTAIYDQIYFVKAPMISNVTTIRTLRSCPCFLHLVQDL